VIATALLLGMAASGASPHIAPLEPGMAVADAPFVDEHGAARTLAEFRGRTLVVSFMYTRCPDAHECSLVSAKFAALQASLPARTALLEFTLDPEYDTPARLLAYGRIFGQRNPPWMFGTGDAETLHRIAASFGVAIDARTAARITHGEVVAVIGERGIVRDLIAGTQWSPAEVVAAVRESQGAPADPVARVSLWFHSTTASALRACGSLASAAHEQPLAAVLIAMVALTAVFFIATPRRSA
jgi:protein SCO1/2